MESIERKTKYRHTIRRSCLRCTGIVTMSTSAIPRFHERIGTSFRTCISPFACNYGTFSFCTCRSLPPGAVFSSLSFQRSLQRSPHSLLVIDDSLGCSHAMGNPQRYYRLLANSSTPRNQRDCYSSQGPKYCNRLNPEYYNRFGTVLCHCPFCFAQSSKALRLQDHVCIPCSSRQFGISQCISFPSSLAPYPINGMRDLCVLENTLTRPFHYTRFYQTPVGPITA